MRVYSALEITSSSRAHPFYIKIRRQWAMRKVLNPVHPREMLTPRWTADEEWCARRRRPTGRILARGKFLHVGAARKLFDGKRVGEIIKKSRFCFSICVRGSLSYCGDEIFLSDTPIFSVFCLRVRHARFKCYASTCKLSTLDAYAAVKNTQFNSTSGEFSDVNLASYSKVLHWQWYEIVGLRKNCSCARGSKKIYNQKYD